MRRVAPFALAALLLWPAVTTLAQDAPAAAELPADCKDLEDGLYARMQTNNGVMVLRLDYEYAPETCANFVGLAEGTKSWTDAASGRSFKKPFYDGLTFHRIIKDFMIQGGCPQGNGMGGPGYKFKDEFHPELRHDGPGVLSMANAGRNTNGSQFFITLAPTPHLDDKHSVFGHIVKGQDVLTKLGAVATGAGDKPVQPVVLERCTIVRKGDAAQGWLKRKKEVPAPTGEPLAVRAAPAAGAPTKDRVKVVVICIQYAGAERAEADVTCTKEEAAAIAGRIAGHCRLAGADAASLARRWSDLPQVEFDLDKAKTDPAFAPAFALSSPGQVSDPAETRFGYMVFVALR